ncbi:MAG: Maf-like protein [Candidatus Nanopelagicales bacterium]|nr:Maf-like protein [Candidatus Nanopelagicales bacterium]MCH9707722.1 Maf-like protein [Actinomycetes bacterium]MCH9850705.1 Maf-like protein [Actinomycetes bacterium]NKB93483.1 septum formation inhibitor Maf [Candidatus Nanopelagicales bacterium]
MSDHETPIRFVLASRSPARLATLRAAGVEPEVIVSHVDEEAIEGSMPDAPPAELAQILARAKAEAIAGALTSPAIVVGCDSVFELDGRPYGKPGTREVARERWQQMFGKNGILHTGHCVIDTATNQRAEATASTTVTMGTMTSQELDDYLATGEPLEVAGGFTLDALGAPFIESIHGDPSTVVGISLPTLRNLLADLGFRWTALWNTNLG